MPAAPRKTRATSRRVRGRVIPTMAGEGGVEGEGERAEGGKGALDKRAEGGGGWRSLYSPNRERVRHVLAGGGCRGCHLLPPSVLSSPAPALLTRPFLALQELTFPHRAVLLLVLAVASRPPFSAFPASLVLARSRRPPPTAISRQLAHLGLSVTPPHSVPYVAHPLSSPSAPANIRCISYFTYQERWRVYPGMMADKVICSHKLPS